MPRTDAIATRPGVEGDGPRLADHHHAAAEGRQSQQTVQHLLAGEEDRPVRQQQPAQLVERHQAAPEGDRADESGGHRGHRGLGRRIRRADQDRTGHQGRGAAAEGVEQRHHLGHRGHLDAERQRRPDRRAEHDPAEKQAERLAAGAEDLLVEERGHHRQQHAGGAQQVAAHRGARVGQAADAEDEQYRGPEVDEIDDAVHDSVLCSRAAASPSSGTCRACDG